MDILTSTIQRIEKDYLNYTNSERLAIWFEYCAENKIPSASPLNKILVMDWIISLYVEYYSFNN